ncbi:Fic family protein [Pusillimonas sp. ANT_WB101]|nr:Fic family protein [Pusillimonas sp. ANT_WB101]
MFNSSHQFQPLLPSEEARARLAPKVSEVLDHATKLSAGAHWVTALKIRELTRSMNSFYSNRIEGQGTHPLNIERALHHDFSDRPDIARRQRLAIAHIEAEKALEAQLGQSRLALSSGIAVSAHKQLYERLPEHDRFSHDGIIVKGGAMREHDVQVGRHAAPAWASVPVFLAHWDKTYSKDWAPHDLLIAAACAHYRFAWVHPFLDGNGRVARLQTHLALLPITQGLWSVSRGFARDVDRYYGALAYADSPRQGDLDGRGNLSEKGLVSWVDIFLDTCLDQVKFQRKMLSLEEMKPRIQALITFLSAQNPGVRKEAILPLQHLFIAGPVSRGDFAQMTGLGERSARYLTSALLKEGLIQSESTRAPIEIGFPLKHLNFLFPNLYPEANTHNFDDQG